MSLIHLITSTKISHSVRESLELHLCASFWDNFERLFVNILFHQIEMACVEQIPTLLLIFCSISSSIIPVLPKVANHLQVVIYPLKESHVQYIIFFVNIHNSFRNLQHHTWKLDEIAWNTILTVYWFEIKHSNFMDGKTISAQSHFASLTSLINMILVHTRLITLPHGVLDYLSSALCPSITQKVSSSNKTFEKFLKYYFLKVHVCAEELVALLSASVRLFRWMANDAIDISVCAPLRLDFWVQYKITRKYVLSCVDKCFDPRECTGSREN